MVKIELMWIKKYLELTDDKNSTHTKLVGLNNCPLKVYIRERKPQNSMSYVFNKKLDKEWNPKRLGENKK